MADIFLSNTLVEDLKNGKFYDAVVVSRDDSLNKGRIKVKVPELSGEEEIWVQSLQPSGGLKIQAIPPEGQEVKVFFNGTIYEGFWLGGNHKKGDVTDPDMILISDDKGNYVTWQRKTGEIKVYSHGQVSIISDIDITLKAPTINLDGVVNCSKGASGLITNMNVAIASKGIVTQIS